MGRISYVKDEYIIIKEGDGIIIYNTEKPFNEGHTHLKSYKAGIDAINFAVHKKIPRRSSIYYLKSLIRISKDKKYIQEINELINVRLQKGKKPATIKRPIK